MRVAGAPWEPWQWLLVDPKELWGGTFEGGVQRVLGEFGAPAGTVRFGQ
jgi:hypothetical protein